MTGGWIQDGKIDHVGHNRVYNSKFNQISFNNKYKSLEDSSFSFQLDICHYIRRKSPPLVWLSSRKACRSVKSCLVWNLTRKTLSLRSALPYFHPRGLRCLLGIQESVNFCCSDKAQILVAYTSKNVFLAHVTCAVVDGLWVCISYHLDVQAAELLWVCSICVIILEHRPKGAAPIWDSSRQWSEPKKVNWVHSWIWSHDLIRHTSCLLTGHWLKQITWPVSQGRGRSGARGENGYLWAVMQTTLHWHRSSGP